MSRRERGSPPTRLEAFIVANKIHRGRLAHATNYQIQHIRDVRLGLVQPTQRCKENIAQACSELLGRAVSVGELFDLVLPIATPHFTARHVRQGEVGFIAFIEQVPALMAWGATRENAEANLKKRFAAWVALERSHGDLLDEFTVLWV